MGYKVRILSKEECWQFRRMTFPAYMNRLGNNSLAVGALGKEGPMGLALFDNTKKNGSAELLSLLVAAPYRGKGVGAQLLRYGESILAESGFKNLHTVWSETVPGARPFAGILKKHNWSEPEKRLLMFRGDISGELGQAVQAQCPRYRTPDCLPRRFSLGLWSDMTPQERTFILSCQDKRDWYEKRSNPFREESALVPKLSLLLKKEGQIAGWLTVHRISAQSLRITDVFIRADLKSAGTATVMLLHALWLQIEHGTSTLTWGVERENDSLIQFLTARIPFIQKNWTYGAKKNLG